MSSSPLRLHLFIVKTRLLGVLIFNNFDILYPYKHFCRFALRCFILLINRLKKLIPSNSFTYVALDLLTRYFIHTHLKKLRFETLTKRAWKFHKGKKTWMINNYSFG